MSLNIITANMNNLSRHIKMCTKNKTKFYHKCDICSKSLSQLNIVANSQQKKSMQN